MTAPRTPRVLLIAPYLSGDATGEPFVAFRWAQALTPLVDLTVACFQSPAHSPIAAQLPGARIVTWPSPRFIPRGGRFAAMLKPEWPIFAARVRAHLRNHSTDYDIAHQIMPQAMRYASPLRGHSLPYVIGPLGGALPTPPAFAYEIAPAGWFTRLRALDGPRLRHDPWLRRSYAHAALVLGVAPYVGRTLAAAGIDLRAYADVLELGIEDLAPPRPARADDRVRLLHVGRGVRTKGLRDAIRAMAQVDDPRLHLTSAGDGPEIAACRAEAARLGVADRVTFLGRIPRAEVEALYRTSDIYVFPSFREPAGNVVYEAMRWGLPIIAAAAGGPDAILDESCAIKVPVTDPETFATDIAAALRRLIGDPALADRLGQGARAKVAAEGLWPNKAAGLVGFYRSVLD
ncbi:glycosyltransferase family 4 protein [Jannaschia donghaensis]|uniref:2-deoxystreptamine glucosyltransferase n=1 Tax=Jannaschia donghaensis TaxID=420998 RepID=A0A0M6YFI7_9RHOB|nr:glycosyltransferase family 4 protein [Jannaschia donghaensis]CTQ48273.1 2-deoxystreptamine glucosyltransferase [Jannaschia donghaensis]